MFCHASPSFQRSILLVVACLCLSRPLLAQFAVDWDAVSGGGGPSTGGDHTLQGTVGQPATGTQTGDRYALTSGFWSRVTVVSTPGAPALRVTWNTQAPGLRLSWPQPAEGWVLQETQVLSGSATEWVTLAGPYGNTGTQLEVVVAIPQGQRFYRLSQ